MSEPPRTDVLAERMDGLSGQVRDAIKRMDGLATHQGLTDLMRGRDELYNRLIAAQSEDIRELTAALATERSERMAADKETETKASAAVIALDGRLNRSRTLALSAIGLTVTVLLGIVGLMAQLGGTPT